ncbi:probable Splicing factor 3b, subunit 2 [Sporisorium reilianum f. sp. reilianum]|uniref:Probable Splicing factor 3b, subunit 2 n=1 Tax=Sporisorium reilianum f. sp. reilianum TaxID=72559 RepID=A0A2N8ULB1_9BASI|nr:probable Splicing factor 3b, subunit 2 [Sporisorium reilianum f. sp. reilianum]
MEVNAVAGPSSGNVPLTKNAKRRLKKKQQQQQQQQQQPASITQPSTATPAAKPDTTANYDDDDAKNGTATASILDEAADLRIDPNSDVYKAFSSVLSRYQPDALSAQQQPSKGEIIYSDDEVQSEHDSDDDDAAAAAATATLSKRKQKKLQRLTVAELKQLVPKPEVVEWTDVTSTDPRLLVHLKCVRNSVPIPPHWATKRDYLQNKRGIEKPQYNLPAYIADTGIATMKDALKEKEAEQSLKQKTRERVQPKMGKMDIDYQKLYDAFFRFQHRPPLSAYGDTYYEGKEYETKYKDKRPGQLSNELIEALSIPPLAPPPWLIAMQRYGPPPSYPHLPIAGLNAPIPQGASWGFHPGGWGRPPVDEYGNPLYGNVLGGTEEQMDADLVDTVEKEHWGQLEPEESDPEDQDDDDEQQSADEEPHEQQQDDDMSGVQSVSSIGTGLQTPSFTELRKDARIDATAAAPPRSLYTVLPERAASSTSGAFMASERTYDFTSTQTHQPHPAAPVLGQEARGTKRTADAVALSINPDELVQHGGVHVDAEQYDAQRRQQAAQRFRYAQDDELGEVRAQLQTEREKRQREEAERRSSRR